MLRLCPRRRILKPSTPSLSTSFKAAFNIAGRVKGFRNSVFETERVAEVRFPVDAIFIFTLDRMLGHKPGCPIHPNASTVARQIRPCASTGGAGRYFTSRSFTSACSLPSSKATLSRPLAYPNAMQSAKRRCYAETPASFPSSSSRAAFQCSGVPAI